MYDEFEQRLTEQVYLEEQSSLPFKKTLQRCQATDVT